MVRTLYRTKGKNCNDKERKKLDSDDKSEQKYNLMWGRYVMACRLAGIKPVANRRILWRKKEKKDKKKK